MELFLSYSHEDKTEANEIRNSLQFHLKTPVWYDGCIYPGKIWEKEIEEHICSCNVFIFLISPTSVKSEYCNKELSMAAELHKNIIPILLKGERVKEENIPLLLKNIQYAKGISGEDFENSIKLYSILNNIHIEHSVYEPFNPIKRSKSLYIIGAIVFVVIALLILSMVIVFISR